MELPVPLEDTDADRALVRVVVKPCRPNPAEPEPSGLGHFLADGVIPWHREPIPLPRRLTHALRCSAGLALGTGAWMADVLRAERPCQRGFCAMTTFGGHPAVLGALALLAAFTLLGLATVTGGLTRAGGPALVPLGLAALTSWVVALGLIAVLLIVLTVLALLIAVLLAVAGSN